MMFERFTDNARNVVVVGAQKEARRLGHDYIGCEHLLLAAVAADEPAAEVLRDGGVTPERVETEILRVIGRGAAADPLRGVDGQALAAIGIDLDLVRARIEAAFGPGALARAAAVHRRAHRAGRPAWGRGPVAAFVHQPVAALNRRRRRRRARRGALPGQPPRPNTPLLPAPPRSGHLPFTPRAKKTLQLSLREALALHDDHIGVQHIILALLIPKDGMPRLILAALGASTDSLRTAILARYRKAS
jgi:Clp amino terminal domain, pathogenicity island component